MEALWKEGVPAAQPMICRGKLQLGDGECMPQVQHAIHVWVWKCAKEFALRCLLALCWCITLKCFCVAPALLCCLLDGQQLIAARLVATLGFFGCRDLYSRMRGIILELKVSNLCRVV